MPKTSLLAAALLALTVSGIPEFVAAMGSNNPTPPQSSQPSGTTTTKYKTKKAKERLGQGVPGPLSRGLCPDLRQGRL